MLNRNTDKKKTHVECNSPTIPCSWFLRFFNLSISNRRWISISCHVDFFLASFSPTAATSASMRTYEFVHGGSFIWSSSFIVMTLLGLGLIEPSSILALANSRDVVSSFSDRTLGVRLLADRWRTSGLLLSLLLKRWEI